MDGLTGPPIANSVILINGEIIEKIGTTDTLPVPAGYEVISTEGMDVLPGLWESHAHLMITGHADYIHWQRTYQGRFASEIMPASAVQLLLAGGEGALVLLIGASFADFVGDNWVYCAALLGALGSFFSGSATISNLTFGGVQDSIAGALALDRTLVLSLQSVGGAMGNMVCINNIVAVCTILGLRNQEGFILKRTILPMLAYAGISALAGILL